MIDAKVRADVTPRLSDYPADRGRRGRLNSCGDRRALQHLVGERLSVESIRDGLHEGRIRQELRLEWITLSMAVELDITFASACKSYQQPLFFVRGRFVLRHRSVSIEIAVVEQVSLGGWVRYNQPDHLVEMNVLRIPIVRILLKDD